MPGAIHNPVDVLSAYNSWAADYDRDENPTRDADLASLQEKAHYFEGKRVIEAGCGTGKNSRWLAAVCRSLYAFDLSRKMLEKAGEKIKASNAFFLLADITRPWPFAANTADVVTINLVLEHIQELWPVFDSAATVLRPEGLLFINELHPKKQAAGTKARFHKGHETIRIDSFHHSAQDYHQSAQRAGFSVVSFEDVWDPVPGQNPRLLSMILKKL